MSVVRTNRDRNEAIALATQALIKGKMDDPAVEKLLVIVTGKLYVHFI